MGEMVQNASGYGEMQHASPAHLLSHVARRTFARPKAAGPAPSMFAQSSILYMTSIFDRRNSVEAAARAAGVSKFHFIRRFKRETGMTPGEFLLRYRTVRAMNLLADTDNAIAVVGRVVGYGDASAFSRAFLNVAGTSPRAYRRAQRDAAAHATETHWAELRAAESIEPYEPQPLAAT